MKQQKIVYQQAINDLKDQYLKYNLTFFSSSFLSNLLFSSHFHRLQHVYSSHRR
ncbi:MAG: hypothetical protein KR126chlam6_00548 [Candidatus Anoxychlamydiales bacterium]|nr:hypothetical protein [Candidatus Anoxychlamydiales bacterium]